MNRIFHKWHLWECYPAGFYEDAPPRGMTQEQGEEAYRELLSDPERFEAALAGVVSEWKHSCEHYLTNERMNRIAWLGQAALAYALHVPACCRGGFRKLTDEQQQAANELALKYLNQWLEAHGEPTLSLEEAASRTQANLY